MPFSLHANSGAVSVMGIVNLSPDSFYDKSRCVSETDALKMAERLVAEGADFLDIGAESSRPGALPVPADEEAGMLTPVVARLCREFPATPVSVDTCKPQVAERVLDQGASLINDITGLQRHPEMAGIIARYGAGVVMMHMRGTPADMQNNPRYDDLIPEIAVYLQKSLAIAAAAGIAEDRMIVDPGIGFGKTTEHNLELLRHLDLFRILNKPVLIGLSRKGFIGDVLGLPAGERLEGSLAAAVVAVMKGARILRAHDVLATVRAARMARALMAPEKS